MALDPSLRARRWDVLVLGGALPGLAAAIRLAMAQHRVLIVEEDAAAKLPAVLREPFFLPGGGRGTALEECLCALGLPPLERRTFERTPIAYQVILPDARVDVGPSPLGAEEWVAWGLAKPELAETLTLELATAARAEGQALLEDDWLSRGGLRSRARAGRGGGPGRGLPGGVASADGALAAFFQAQARALSSLGSSAPSSEACARLLGAAYAEGGLLPSPKEGLRALLRRRLETLHAEFRTLGCPFEFVELGDHPGISRRGPDDVWLGRTVLVNAPAPCLTSALEDWNVPVPAFLAGQEAPVWRRLVVHMRALREALPEGLAPRAILTDPDTGPISLALHDSPRGRPFVEVVASAPVRDEPDQDEAHAARIFEAVRALMPFCDERIKPGPLHPRPLWDDEFALVDPRPKAGWPAPVELRGPGRRPVYHLPREEVASLGPEGELLLGWRAGEAIRQELS